MLRHPRPGAGCRICCLSSCAYRRAQPYRVVAADSRLHRRSWRPHASAPPSARAWAQTGVQRFHQPTENWCAKRAQVGLLRGRGPAAARPAVGAKEVPPPAPALGPPTPQTGPAESVRYDSVPRSALMRCAQRGEGAVFSLPLPYAFLVPTVQQAVSWQQGFLIIHTESARARPSPARAPAAAGAAEAKTLGLTPPGRPDKCREVSQTACIHKAYKTEKKFKEAGKAGPQQTRSLSHCAQNALGNAQHARPKCGPAPRRAWAPAAPHPLRAGGAPAAVRLIRLPDAGAHPAMVGGACRRTLGADTHTLPPAAPPGHGNRGANQTQHSTRPARGGRTSHTRGGPSPHEHGRRGRAARAKPFAPPCHSDRMLDCSAICENRTWRRLDSIRGVPTRAQPRGGPLPRPTNTRLHTQLTTILPRSAPGAAGPRPGAAAAQGCALPARPARQAAS